METGDIVLVSLREYEEDKADIIHKYYTGEATHLIRVGEIPDSGTCTFISCIIILLCSSDRLGVQLDLVRTKKAKGKKRSR